MAIFCFQDSLLDDGQIASATFLLLIAGVAGDGVGVEAPQFAQTSLKYLHLDHPLRRACIRYNWKE